MVSFIFFLASTVSIQLIMIKSDGYPSRVAKIFREIEALQGAKWGLMQDGKPCFGRQKDFCEYRNNSNFWVQLIGDSHLESLSRNLFEGLSEKFSISDMTSGGCWPIGLIRKTTGNGPLDKSPCKEEYQRLRLEKVMGKKNSIIVIGARFPLYLSNRTFNNEEGGVETIDDTEIFSKFESVIPDLSLDEAFQKVVVELLEKGHRIIFVYPIPEVGWDVPTKLYSHIPSKGALRRINLMSNPITTSYERYLQRTKSSFELLDNIKHPNLYRVYPHKLVCDSQIPGRCITHDEKTIYYNDDDHPSNKFAALINKLILEKVFKISKKN